MASDKSRTISRNVRAALCICAANAPFWYLSTKYFTSRALISLDSIIALLVWSISPLGGVALLLSSWIADIAVSAASIFHFADVRELLSSLQFGGALDRGRLLLHWLPLAAPFAAAIIAILVLKPGKIRSVSFVAALACCLVVDVINGSSALHQLSIRRGDQNLAGSSLYAVLHETFIGDAPPSALAPTQQPYLLESFFGELPSDASVLYVLVESLGKPNDPELVSQLRHRLLNDRLSTLYSVREGTIPFKGGTPAGELRSLCGLAGSYTSILQTDTSVCTPNILARKGWHTIGIHGFSQSMFERGRWWPSIGLQTRYFAEELSEHYERRCGAAFRGICDVDAVSFALTQLRERTFVYLLTLNSHLPLPPEDPPDDLRRICERKNLSREACLMIAATGRVLEAIREGLLQTRPFAYVFIVGDHSPPFAETASREIFDSARVPFYAMTPKSHGYK